MKGRLIRQQQFAAYDSQRISNKLGDMTAYHNVALACLCTRWDSFHAFRHPIRGLVPAGSRLRGSEHVGERVVIDTVDSIAYCCHLT